MVLENLAVIHACSHSLLQKLGSTEKFDASYKVCNSKNMFPNGGDEDVAKNNEKIMTNIFLGWLKTLENHYSDTHPELIEKMKRFQNTRAGFMLKAIDRESAEFLCLNHGDPWAHNFMFRYKCL